MNSPFFFCLVHIPKNIYLWLNVCISERKTFVTVSKEKFAYQIRFRVPVCFMVLWYVKMSECPILNPYCEHELEHTISNCTECSAHTVAFQSSQIYTRKTLATPQWKRKWKAQRNGLTEPHREQQIIWMCITSSRLL